MSDRLEYRPITPDMLRDQLPDLRAVLYARLRGERPGCSCRPIHAWPDGPIVGYHDLCEEHRLPAP